MAYQPAGDRISMGASLLCLAHCVLLPFVLSLFPFWKGSLPGHGWVEGGLLLVSGGIGGWAISRGYQTHNRVPAVIGFLLGLLLVGLGSLPQLERVEMGVKGAGGLLLIAAHWWNLRQGCRCAGCRRKSLLREKDPGNVPEVQ